jgi:hypothetical protein
MAIALFFIVGGPTAADKRLEESNDDADRKSLFFYIYQEIKRVVWLEN